MDEIKSDIQSVMTPYESEYVYDSRKYEKYGNLYRREERSSQKKRE